MAHLESGHSVGDIVTLSAPPTVGGPSLAWIQLFPRTLPRPQAPGLRPGTLAAFGSLFPGPEVPSWGLPCATGTGCCQPPHQGLLQPQDDSGRLQPLRLSSPLPKDTDMA